MVEIERLHRGRGDAENLIRGAKQTGLENLPFREFDLNAVWLELSLIAQDLIAWTQRLCLTGELAICEPKALRYRLLHTAGRLSFHARRAVLRLPANWPWAGAARRRVRPTTRAAITRRLINPRRPREHDEVQDRRSTPTVSCRDKPDARAALTTARLRPPPCGGDQQPEDLHPRRSGDSAVTNPRLLHDPGLNAPDSTTYPTATDQTGIPESARRWRGRALSFRLK